MNDFLRILEKKNIALPDDIFDLLSSCRNYKIFDSVEQLAIAAVGGENRNSYKVKYCLSSAMSGPRVA